MKKIIFILFVSLNMMTVGAEEREEMVPFGDMDSWLTRQIEESGIIGGATKILYEVGPKMELVGNNAYENVGGSPWASSNVYARVAGVHKTNSSVFPVDHNGGKAAHLMTRIEQVKVLGLVNISVIAAGSVYVGSMMEPIKGTSNPQGLLNSGIPFTKRPKAVRYDYKIELSGEPNRLRITGFSPKKEVEGMDMPTMVMLLQKRWEDSDGTLHASRVGTIIVNYTQSSDWVENATYDVIYGDATNYAEFIPSMALGYEQRYALNSKGDNVPLIEESWASADEIPTHIILHFASSHGGAYVGSPGTQMWIDNVRLVY